MSSSFVTEKRDLSATISGSNTTYKKHRKQARGLKRVEAFPRCQRTTQEVSGKCFNYVESHQTPVQFIN